MTDRQFNHLISLIDDDLDRHELTIQNCQVAGEDKDWLCKGAKQDKKDLLAIKKELTQYQEKQRPIPKKSEITKENAVERGFSICPKCGEIVMALFNANECAECAYLRSHPNAVKHVCATCANFRHHELYEPENHDGFCCKKFLEGKNADSYRYDCPGFAPAKEQEIQLTLNL